MNSWPMISRCMEAQWRGYSPEVQMQMIAEWSQTRGGTPGIIGNTGHRLLPIWHVYHGNGNHTHGDILMSIKEDYGPALVDCEKRIEVG